MSVKIGPINKIDNTKRDYVAAGILGVLGGYAIKNVMPLSSYERDEFFTHKVNQSLVEKEKIARKAEYDSIVESAGKGTEQIPNDVLDLFRSNETNILEDQFDKLVNNLKDKSEQVQDGVIKLSKRVKDSGCEAKSAQKKAIEALAKSSRPTSYFVLATTAVLLSFAVLKNALYKNMDINDTSNDCENCDYYV